MFVFQKDTHDVVFPNREYKDNKYVDIKGDRKDALELDVDVVDVGVPVLSMHAPFEGVSKLDVYMTYRAVKAFYEA